jgi:hypothetical protein
MTSVPTSPPFDPDRYRSAAAQYEKGRVPYSPCRRSATSLNEPIRDLLVDDVMILVRRFAEVTCQDRVDIRLEAVDHDSCWRFPSRPCRLPAKCHRSRTWHAMAPAGACPTRRESAATLPWPAERSRPFLRRVVQGRSSCRPPRTIAPLAAHRGQQREPAVPLPQ